VLKAIKNNTANTKLAQSYSYKIDTGNGTLTFNLIKYKPRPMRVYEMVLDKDGKKVKCKVGETGSIIPSQWIMSSTKLSH